MNSRIPIIIHIPHAATHIPLEERQRILLSGDALEHELLLMTDWYVDELFAAPNYQRLVNPVSRLVVDPERFRDDQIEEMTKYGMGAAYTRASSGAVLRTLSAEDREALLIKYYDPHHTALTELVERQLEQSDQCTIIDAHSFRSSPLPHEADKALPRPDICIGFDDFHAGPDLQRLVSEHFRHAGLTVAHNRPFAGSLVPDRYFRLDRRVSSLMIEVNRALYMDEQIGSKLARFAKVQRLIAGCLDRVATLSPTPFSPSLQPRTQLPHGFLPPQ